MAYINGKRTVYCRQCYQTGHNRRGCPQLSDVVKARYKSGDLQRKCSWCRQGGHTKAKCEIRQGEIVAYVKENAKYRQEILAIMENMGMGYGALCAKARSYARPTRRNERRELNKEELYIITKIDWDKVQLKDKDNRVVKAHNVIRDYEYEYAFCVPATVDIYWAYSQLEVINKAKTSIRNDMPADWLTGRSGVDKYF